MTGPRPKRFYETWSFALACLAAVSAPSSKKAAATCLALLGFGYGGAIIERYTGDDLRYVHQLRQYRDWGQLGLHVAAGGLGLWLWTKGRKANV